MPYSSQKIVEIIESAEFAAIIDSMSLGLGGPLRSDLQRLCGDFVGAGYRRPTVFLGNLKQIFSIHEAKVKVHYLPKHLQPAPKVTVKAGDLAIKPRQGRRGSDAFLDFFQKDLPLLGRRASQAMKEAGKVVEHKVVQIQAEVAEHISDEKREAREALDAAARKAGKDKNLFRLYDLECRLGLTTSEQSLEKKLRLRRDFSPVAQREGLSEEGLLEVEGRAFLMQLIEFGRQSDVIHFLSSELGEHCVASIAHLPEEFVERFRSQILSVFTVLKRRFPDMDIAPFRQAFSDDYICECLSKRPDCLAGADMFAVFRSVFDGLGIEAKLDLLAEKDLFLQQRRLLMESIIQSAAVNAVFFIGLRKINRLERQEMAGFFMQQGRPILQMLATIYELLDDLEAQEKNVIPCGDQDKVEHKKGARVALRKLLLDALISGDDADLVASLALISTRLRAWPQDADRWRDVISGGISHRLRDIMVKAERAFAPASTAVTIHGGNIFRRADVAVEAVPAAAAEL